MTPILARRICLALCPSHIFNNIEYLTKSITRLDNKPIRVGHEFTLAEITTAKLDRVQISWDIAQACMMDVDGVSANISAIMTWLEKLDSGSCTTQNIEG